MTDIALNKLEQIKDIIICYANHISDNSYIEDLIQDGVLRTIEVLQHKRYVSYSPNYIFLNFIKPYMDSKYTEYIQEEITDNIKCIFYYDSYDLNCNYDDLIKMGASHGSFNPERDIKIISSFFGFDDGTKKNCEELSQIYGITRSRIAQIITKFTSYLNSRYKNGTLDKYI